MFFQNESSLEYHEAYTTTTCKLECGIQAVEKEMQYVPWYLPQGNDSIVCDPWKAETFREKLGVFDHTSCRCFSLCSETRYRADLTAAAFRRCDSRNLNLSPLCNLFKTGVPAPWKPWVRNIYEKYGDVPAYLEDVEGTTRNYYSNEYLKNLEIISSLTQEEVSTYNALESDIA